MLGISICIESWVLKSLEFVYCEEAVPISQSLKIIKDFGVQIYYFRSHFRVYIINSNEQSCQVFCWDELRLFWKILLFKLTNQPKNPNRTATTTKPNQIKNSKRRTKKGGRKRFCFNEKLCFACQGANFQ